MLWAKAAPRRVSTDTVIPFYYKDDGVFKNVNPHLVWRFEDVLDPEKLRTSLEHLIERHGQWRKLGARIRMNESEGKLEYHVPISFDREHRPSVKYHHTNVETSIEDHPLEADWPKAQGVPALFKQSDVINSLLYSHLKPEGVDHWLTTDDPLLLLHVISFTDATIVSMIYNHATMDGIALTTLHVGWQAVLNGQEDKIPPFAAFENDPILPLASKTPSDQYIFRDECRGGLAFARFAANFVWQQLTQPVEHRTILLPPPFVAAIRKKAMEEARALDSTKGEDLFLSDGDVLQTWWTRLAVSALELPDNSTVGINNAMDIRDFTEGRIPPGSMFQGNALDTAVTFITAKDLQRQPLGLTASRARRNIIRLRTQAQVEAKMNLDKASGSTAFLGPGDQTHLLVTNWTKCGFYNVNFSAAVVGNAEPKRGRSSPRGQPASIMIDMLSKVKLRNAGPIMGKDARGNWWLMWRMRSSAWPAVERALAEMGKPGWKPGDEDLDKKPQRRPLESKL